ncbi:hypothetical protein [Janthinobacterium sp. 17J80-10]|uniref:hypothetical protein n=1 Tax=Janthinobacterium sp. 17J80-10 TaxID=2497863 RepID=UPI001005A221|nr:hypothetical protein [Janthinobacterium sp. 17J80-10]QAU33731.1 hypothetical protein EKL02_05770 [Janthinobacterium sp. 17J80-10]
MEKLYLSRRDLATLLQKLDSVRNGEVSACTIIKNDTTHPVYPPTLRRIAVVAVEGADQYLPGVSPRLHLSRTALTGLLDQLDRQVQGLVRFDGLEAFAVPDEKYYVDRDEADTMPVGDLFSAFIRGRGKQR